MILHSILQTLNMKALVYKKWPEFLHWIGNHVQSLRVEYISYHPELFLLLYMHLSSIYMQLDCSLKKQF